MAETPWRQNSKTLEVDQSIEFTEQATVPGGAPSAGFGKVWVRNDGPNVPIFTDDAGTDWVLNSSGAGGTSGTAGNIYENLQFYMDPTDPNSYSGTGATVTDIKGNATGGTLTTGTFENGGFEFNGSTGDLTFTKGSALDNIFSGGGTVIAFFQTDSDGESNSGRLATTEGGGGAVGWAFYVTSEVSDYLSIRFDRMTSSTDGGWTMDNIDGTRPIRNGSWACVGITYDDASLSNDPTMYLNGLDVASSEASTPAGTFGSDAGEDIFIGNRDADNRTFDGTIGLVLFFDRELTAEEHALVYSTFGPRYGSGLRGRPQQTAGLPGADVLLAAGDWVGTTTTSGSHGGDMKIRAGHTDGTGTSTDGGSLFLLGGDVGGGNGEGGFFILKGGTGGIGNTTDCEVAAGDCTTGNKASSLLVHGGDNTSTGSGGDLTCRGGESVSGPGGDLFLAAGDSSGIGDDPGNIFIRTGENGSSLPATGDILITTDRATGTGGATGDITIETGEQGNSSSNTGEIFITGGDASGSGPAGHITLQGGNNTATSAGDGGDITMACGTSADGDGGEFTFTGGNSTSADAGDPAGGFTFQGGNQTSGGPDGTSGGGGFTFTGGSCAKTATTSPAGGFAVTGGSGTGNSANSRGGPISLTGGDVTGTTAGAVAGGITLQGGQSTNAAGTCGSVTVSGGDSPITGATPGDVNINGGLATAGNADGGNVAVAAGAAAGTGTNGQITLTTTDSDGPVGVRTQSTFTGTIREHFTHGAQDTLSAGTFNTLLVTLGTLATNGRNMKIEVYATAQDNASDSGMESFHLVQTFYRSSGTVTGMTAHQNDSQGNGSFGSDWSFGVVVTSNNINLEINNAASVASYTANMSVWWTIQEGGFTS